MTKTTWWARAIGVGVLGGLAMLGCGTGDTLGGAGVDLAWVDEATIEGRSDLYIDPSISWRPMTLAQLGGDGISAIPVDVEVFGGVAVAWIRREGVQEAPRTRADIVALFRVVEHATPASDETYREGDGPVYVPPTRFAGTIEAGDDAASRVDLDLPVAGRYALVEFFDRSRFPPQQDIELWRELNENHPGCL